MFWNNDFFRLQAIYPDLFKLMVNNGNFFVCLVKSDPNDQHYNAYLEHPPEGSNISGVMRIFCRKTDANFYAQLVARAEGMDMAGIKRWESTFTDILGYVRDLEMKHASFNMPGIRAVTSIVSDEEFVDADIFWTGELEKMV
jgi:hypothetical protein